MGRAYDFVASGVLMAISIIIHLIAVELFKPSGPLYGVATDGTSNMNGAARAALWFEILSVWVPLAVFGASMLWVLIREYRRQIQTSIGQPRARP